MCLGFVPWYTSAGKEFFDSQLKPIFNVGLIDPIYSIRQACITIIKDMSDIFGPDWTVQHLVRIAFNRRIGTIRLCWHARMPTTVVHAKGCATSQAY